MGLRELVDDGHQVIVQETAGIGSGFSDSEYKEAGATMMRSPEDIVKAADILVRLKSHCQKNIILLEQGCR